MITSQASLFCTIFQLKRGGAKSGISLLNFRPPLKNQLKKLGLFGVTINRKAMSIAVVLSFGWDNFHDSTLPQP